MSEEEEKAAVEPLNAEHIKAGLEVIGKHPVTLNHTFLQLNVKNSNLGDIEELAKYPGLMYVDLSGNSISTCSVLKNLPGLVQLNLSNNMLSDCLEYSLQKCSKDSSWSTGDTAMGSMLTNANLSFNSISQINSLAHHPFLEVLMLSNNSISEIQGLSSLKFLQVLDMSHNSIASLAGLEGLNVREINLQGNRLADISGLETCAKLSSLNISKNQVRTLYPLRVCAALMWLDAGDNEIVYIRQAEHLAGLQWLSALTLIGNPCSKKQMYRRRLVRRLPALLKLDTSAVAAEERIETANLFHNPEHSDIEGRSHIFHKHFPRDVFESNTVFCDEEDMLTDAELQVV